VVIRIETSGIEVFDPKGTGPCTVYLCVSCRSVLCRELIILGQ